MIDVDEFERDPQFAPETFYHPTENGKELDCKEAHVSTSRWHLLLDKMAKQATNPVRKQNMKMIEQHNEESFSMTANKYIDLSFDEFISQHTGYRPVKGATFKHNVPFEHPELDP